ncbi:MAG: hypothetical protein HC880_00425 [Bacteroidia bacterium]|nr:hypothetical protein [Bacteroidia bacterium]
MNPIEIKAILSEIEASGKKFQKKDQSFIVSMRELVENGRYASTKQSKWLQNLYRISQGGNQYQPRQYVKRGIYDRSADQYRSL